MFSIADAVKNVNQAKGRPLGKNTDTKAYEKTTFSSTKHEKEKLAAYAKKHFDGNVSLCIKKALKDAGIL